MVKQKEPKEPPATVIEIQPETPTSEPKVEGVDPEFKDQTSPQALAGSPGTDIDKIPIIPYSRPTQQKGTQETGSVIVAKALASQLGSDPRHLAQQLIDERKVAVVNELTATALGYFAYRGSVDHQRFWNHIVGWELVISQAIDGRGRRDILTALANTSGLQTSEIARQPNVLARNITKRDWKEKAQASGKTVIED